MRALYNSLINYIKTKIHKPHNQNQITSITEGNFCYSCLKGLSSLVYKQLVKVNKNKIIRKTCKDKIQKDISQEILYNCSKLKYFNSLKMRVMLVKLQNCLLKTYQTNKMNTFQIVHCKIWKSQYTDDGNENCHKISEHFGNAYLSNFISKNIS